MKRCGLVPNSYIHVYVSDLSISVIGPPTLLQQNRWSNRGYTEVAQKYMNVEIGNEAAQFHLWEIGSCLQCIWCTNQRMLVNKTIPCYVPLFLHCSFPHFIFPKKHFRMSLSPDVEK
jgi:hypothetical protein